MIESKEIKYIYSLIKGDKLININNFIQKEDFNSYIEFKDEQEITGIFMPLINIFTKETAPVLITALRKYTGASFKDINAILRNNWDNEINGEVDKEKIKEISELTTNIEKAISLFPKTNKNFIVFRGVTIDAFKKYGVQNLNELNHLKEHFIYEDGFTSTALTKEASYFETEIENHGTSNILIKYYVPKEFNEGAPLTSYILSYKKEQLEFLLSKESLAKVLDIKTSENKAIIETILIPKSIWK